jgi:hypothetical protein
VSRCHTCQVTENSSFYFGPSHLYVAADTVTSEEEIQFRKSNRITDDPGGRAVLGVGLRPFACWDCGFESRRGHGCLALVNIVCFLVEVSVSGGSLAQRNRT